jgi:hypothetical protein
MSAWTEATVSGGEDPLQIAKQLLRALVADR